MESKAENTSLTKRILDLCSTPLLLIEKDIISACNSSAEDYLGKRSRELIGKPLADILSSHGISSNGEAPVEHFRLDKQISTTQAASAENQSDIKKLDISNDPFLEEDSYILQIDIESEGDAISAMGYRKILRDAKIAHFSLSKRGIIQFVNSPAADLLKYDQENLLKRNFDVLIKDSDSSSRRATAQIIDELLQDKTIHDLEIELVSSEGNPIWVSLTALRAESSKGTTFEILAHDISARKSAEQSEKMAQAQADLWTEVMTHDLNNVNQSILFSVGYALETANLPTAVERKLEEARWEIKRGARMISNLRKLTHLRGYSKRREIMNLKRILDDVIADVKDQIGHKEIEVRIEGDPSKINILGNDYLDDVFYNVIENSVVHNTDLLCKITIRMEKIEFRRKVRIEIEDRGPGIPDKLKEVVFNRTGGPGEQTVGRGLGLTLVDAIVESIGGEIWAEDRVAGDVSSGTRIVIELDLWKEDVSLKCGKSSCIAFYKSDHCLFCDPSLDVLKGVLKEHGITSSVIEIINVDDPSVNISQDDLPMLPVARICDKEFAGMINVSQIRQAIMNLLMKDCATVT